MDIVYLMSKWDEQLNRRMARKKEGSKSVLALFQKNKKAYYNLFYVYTHCLKTSGNILCPRIMDRWSNGAKQWQDENGEYKIFTTNEEDASAASLSISKGPAKKKRRRAPGGSGSGPSTDASARAGGAVDMVCCCPGCFSRAFLCVGVRFVKTVASSQSLTPVHGSRRRSSSWPK